MAVLGSFLKSGIKLTGTIQDSIPVVPFKAQKKTLTKLINKARNTQFGEKYDFDSILNASIFEDGKEFYEEFKSKVPIHDYKKMYDEWWHKSKSGEADVCWPGVTEHFALSSGTSDSASKVIPVTKEMIKAIQRTSINQIISLGKYKTLPANLYEKGYLMLGGSTLLNQVDTHYEGDLSGITQKTIPFWFDRFYKPGKRIAQLKDWGSKLDEIAQNAADWDIGFLAGVPAWVQLLMEKVISHYGVKDIHEIWPNLEVFAWGGVSFDPYRQSFEKLLGRPILYLETYLASEGFIAYQARPNADIQLVVNNGIFFEFIPFNENNFDGDGNMVENPETILLDEVKPNVDYALLISTCSGAWRYLIGDTVKFTNTDRAEIKITGRTKHFLSLCGEHLSVDNMNKAVDLANTELELDIKEFTVLGIKHPPLFAHQWYIGTDAEITDKQAAAFIDSKLKELNDDYGVEREHALKNVFCRVLPSKAFNEWMKLKGKEGGQHKFPRVLKGATADDWESFVKINYPK